MTKMQLAKAVMKNSLEFCNSLGIEVGHIGKHEGFRSAVLTIDTLEFQFTDEEEPKET